MVFELSERIIILTSEKWVEKHEIANQIGTAIGDTKAVVIHYSFLRKKYTKKLGSDYTKAKLDAKILEHIARAISAALLTKAYLVIDTDIVDIPGFDTLLHTIERILILIGEMKDEYEETAPKNSGPLHVLHLSIGGSEEEKEAYYNRLHAEYMDELFPKMGDDAKILADLLLKEEKARFEHDHTEYAGLLFKKYYTFSPMIELGEESIDKKEEITFKANL